MKKFLLILAFFTSLSAFAEEVTTNLVVWAKDGSKVAYALAEKPNVTFTETDMVIKTCTIEVNYSMTQLARFTYEKTDPSSIINIEGESLNPFDFNGETLMFPASDSDSKLGIYTVDGKTVLQRNIRKGESLAVSLSNFGKGVYMVRVNDITYKIMKR